MGILFTFLLLGQSYATKSCFRKRGCILIQCSRRPVNSGEDSGHGGRCGKLPDHTSTYTPET